jgi:hypothetical protein
VVRIKGTVLLLQGFSVSVTQGSDTDRANNHYAFRAQSSAVQCFIVTTGVRFSILDEVTVWKGSGKYVIQADTGNIANPSLDKE